MSSRNTTETNSKNNSSSDREVRIEKAESKGGYSKRPNLPVQARRRPLAPNFGQRPVEASELDLVESDLPSNRPVEASSLKVSGTVSSYGTRPIAASDMEVISTIVLSGNRPVSSSDLAKADTTWLPGGKRPVASNDLGEEAALMGFID
ncbi:MAG: hypothetical protein AAGA67_03930 [Cyanobacteria bacterium P01_F01_bin.153]